MVLLRKKLQCQEVVELVTDYLDGALPGALAKAVNRHLAGCKDCTGFVEQIRATIALAGALPPEDVPQAVIDALTAAFEEYQSDPDGHANPQ
jgi:anti-sigma factor RsiW